MNGQVKRGYSHAKILPILIKIQEKEGSISLMIAKTKISESTLRYYFRKEYEYISSENYRKILAAYGKSFPELADLEEEDFAIPNRGFGKKSKNKKVQIKTSKPAISNPPDSAKPADSVFERALEALLILQLEPAIKALKQQCASQDQITKLLERIWEYFGLKIKTEKKSQISRDEVTVADILGIKNFRILPEGVFTETDFSDTIAQMINLRQRLNIILQLEDQTMVHKLRIQFNNELDELFLMLEGLSKLSGSNAAHFIEKQRVAMDELRKTNKGGPKA